MLANRSRYFIASNLGGIDPEKLYRAILIRQTANVNLYNITKYSLNLSFAVLYKYTEISRFTPVFIHKNSFGLFFIGSFSILT